MSALREYRRVAVFDSVVVICCAGDGAGATIITSALAAGATIVVWPPELPDDDAALLRNVQAYLRCRRLHRPTPFCLQRAWDYFYDRYHCLVRHVVAAYCRSARIMTLLDDLVQEVWREILLALRKGRYDAARGGLPAWLVGLTHRATHRVVKDLTDTRVQQSVAIESLRTALPSPHPGPEELCLMKELWNRWNNALAELQMQIPPDTYDIYCRRFLERQTVGDIADAMGMTAKAVYRRCDRLKQKWPTLIEG